MSQRKEAYVTSYHGALPRHVVCHDYRGIPNIDKYIYFLW